MKKFFVEFSGSFKYSTEVEAENKEQALEKAIDGAEIDDFEIEDDYVSEQ